jgi:hypothetical protein
MLYAMMGDCNVETCLFGIASRTADAKTHINGKIPLLIGFGAGRAVTYVRVDLSVL